MAFKTAFSTGRQFAWIRVRSNSTYERTLELAHEKNPYKSEEKRQDYIDGVKDMLSRLGCTPSAETAEYDCSTSGLEQGKGCTDCQNIHNLVQTSPETPEETGKQYAMERIPSAGSFEALCHIYETARDNNPYSRLEDQSHFLIGVHRTLEAEIDRQYPESPEDLPQVSPVKKTEKEYTVYFDHQIVGTIHSTGYLSAANSAMLNIGVTEVELLTVERGDKRVTYHNVLIDADNDITYEWKDVDHSAHPDTPNTPEVEPDVKEVFCRHEAVDNVKARLQKLNARIYHTEIVDSRTTGIAYYTSLCALSPQHTYKKGQKVMLSGLTPEVYGVILETYPNFEQSGETAYAVQLEESRHAHGGLETEVDVFSHHLLTSVEGTKL